MLADILGPAAPADLIARCVVGILGQCFFFRPGKALALKLVPGLRYDAEGLGIMGRHIADNTINGVQVMLDGRDPA